ncbi:DUF5642 family protein [Mycobacterium sp.]|uniref:DUF5642 family protein n=1 Tax=Mycobacterium sp. TaxID=1785 RepID=UPI0031E1213D
MITPPPAARHIAALLAAASVTAALTACSHTTQHTPPGSPSAAPSSSSAPAGADISRVDNVKNDFPPGFTVEVHPARTLNRHDLGSSDIDPFAGTTVDPPHCGPAIIPPNTTLSIGTQVAAVSGHADRGIIEVDALRLPKPIAPVPPPAGCDTVTLSGSPEVSGTAERVPAPTIDGVTTTAIKTTGAGQEDPEYLFTAALNDHTTVMVTGNTDAALNPQHVMSDLLVKAVLAVRGR